MVMEGINNSYSCVHDCIVTYVERATLSEKIWTVVRSLFIGAAFLIPAFYRTSLEIAISVAGTVFWAYLFFEVMHSGYCMLHSES